MALTLFGLILERERIGYIVKHGTLCGMGAGLFNGASNFAGLLLLLYMPISLSTPLTTGVNIVLSFALSVFIYKEKFTKMQISGAVACYTFKCGKVYIGLKSFFV